MFEHKSMKVKEKTVSGREMRQSKFKDHFLEGEGCWGQLAPGKQQPNLKDLGKLWYLGEGRSGTGSRLV